MNFAFLTIFAFLTVAVHSLTPSELHDLRVQRVIETQTASNWDCGTFRAWLNDDDVTSEDVKFCLANIGCYDGRIAISEYYDLALPPGGGCGNFFERQLVRLDAETIAKSVVQSPENPDIYTGYHTVTGYYGPDFSTPDSFTVITKGHHSATRAEFIPGTAILKKWATETYGNELIEVSIQADAITKPQDLCGLMSLAQNVYESRFGYYPNNVSGFDLRSSAGSFDCITYWATIQAEGDDKCGTPLATHSLICPQLHMLTFLGDDAAAVHAQHWAKRGLPTHTKCIDFCLPVLETCHPDANPIPASKINFEQGKIDYFCQCPVGYKGDGVNSCDPVSCTNSEQCKSPRGSYCDLDAGMCMPIDTYSWDPVKGEAYCPDDHRDYYNSTTKEFECIADFKCWTDKECDIQQTGTVSCQYPGNLASPLGVCVCNPGYEGGYNFTCTCPPEKNEHSVPQNGKVCLASGECTIDGHCSSGQVCGFSNPEDVIGHCQ